MQWVEVEQTVYYMDRTLPSVAGGLRPINLLLMGMGFIREVVERWRSVITTYLSIAMMQVRIGIVVIHLSFQRLERGRHGMEHDGW